ncbi:MAG: biotin--[acetyl-CoA-carboxylase] ligase [Acidovorax sp.]|nr:biotin--[acetyl-CoA-carboxylase] ligase [Acidovorax sp.]
MSAALPPWPLEDVWQAVVGQLPGFTVELLPQIDSTNTELMRRARAGRCEPTLLVAEEQTAGRGRLGRQWQSTQPQAAQDALTFSLGLPLAPRDWSGLSLAVGLALAEALHPDIAIKWPNDLWLGERKLCGILIETATTVPVGGYHSPERYCVIGVGLNIRVPASDAFRTPAAGLCELDPDANARTALGRVAPALVAAVLEFARHGFAPLQARFAQRDLLRWRPVRLSDAHGGSEGLCEGVAADGALLVRDASGVLQSITSAEVSVRPHPHPHAPGA